MTGTQLKSVPGEYFRRNWLVGFIRDPYGVKNRYDVGVENMLWASDFPHHVNDWPHSRHLNAEMSLGVLEEAAGSSFCENAGRLYSFLPGGERVVRGAA